MMATVSSLALACGLSSAAPSDTPPSTVLEVDVSAIPDAEIAAKLETRLVEQQTDTLAQSEITVVDAADEHDFTIAVTVAFAGERGLDYQATVTLASVEDEALVSETTITCERCTDSELVAKVREVVTRLTGQMLYARTEDEPNPDAEGAGHDDRREADVPRADGTDTRRIGPLGGAGIGLLAVGIGGVGAGIPLAVRPAAVRGDPGEIEERSLRPLGIGLSVAGGLLVAGGAALIAIDVTRRKKQRKTTYMPSVTARQITFTISHRF